MKAAALFFLALLVGCTTTAGRKIDQSYISSLKPGVTQIGEVKRQLGTPDSLIRNSKGRVTMTWGYAKVSSLGSIESEGISITFDSEGRLEDYKYQTYNP